MGGASAPTTHPHHSRPYAAMDLPDSLTKIPTPESTTPAPYARGKLAPHIWWNHPDMLYRQSHSDMVDCV